MHRWFGIVLIICGVAYGVEQNSGTNFWNQFTIAQTGRSCAYPGAMEKLQEIAKKYPNPEILILTGPERTQVERQIRNWNIQRKQPRLGIDPCSTCDGQYSGCVLYKIYEGSVTYDDDPVSPTPPPLQGDVQQQGKYQNNPGICEQYAASVDPFQGRLHVVPKTSRGHEYYCYTSFTRWTLLGEDGNYCCYFGPFDWVDKDPPPLPGNIDEDYPIPDRRPDPPDPPPTTLPAKVQKICNLQQLAAWVFDRYDSPVGPIATVRVQNATRPTYLILLSGMQVYRLGQATTELDALIAYFNVQALDAYLAAILDAARSLPQGSDLILVGHSLGGMEAENAVGPLKSMGFHVPQVITYGSPTSSFREGETQYLYVRAMHDPVPMMDRIYAFSRDFIIIPGGTDPNPFASPNGSHFVYPHSPTLSTRAIPRIPILRTPCLELDLRTFNEWAAPPNFNRIFGTPTGPYPSQVSESPRNPDQCRRNCLWASLAQDKYYETGGSNDLRYWAECEPERMPSEDVPIILKRWYGHKALDDFHGPDPQDGIDRHKNGEMVKSSPAGIAYALRRAGHGSRGLVFWKSSPNEPIGHVFNVRNVKGEIQYWDAQGPCDSRGLIEPAAGAYLQFYRTN